MVVWIWLLDSCYSINVLTYTHTHTHTHKYAKNNKINKKVSLLIVLWIISLTVISIPLQNWSDSSTVEVNFQVQPQCHSVKFIEKTFLLQGHKMRSYLDQLSHKSMPVITRETGGSIQTYHSLQKSNSKCMWGWRSRSNTT